jgi:hypothetical protein
MGDTEQQINQLRTQVETLMRERVTPALADAAGRAETAVRRSQSAIREQSEAVSGQVRHNSRSAPNDLARPWILHSFRQQFAASPFRR